MTHIPTDAEIFAAATELGVLDEHGRVPPGKRAQLAKTIQLAAHETTHRNYGADDAEGFATRIMQFQDALDDVGVRPETAARVIGAIAAPLWREMKEQTAHGKQ